MTSELKTIKETVEENIGRFLNDDEVRELESYIGRVNNSEACVTEWYKWAEEHGGDVLLSFTCFEAGWDAAMNHALQSDPANPPK